MVQALWAVLALLVKHRGALSSPSPPAASKKAPPIAPEAELAAVLVPTWAGRGAGCSVLQPSPAEAQGHAAAQEVQQLLLSGKRAEALK